MQKYQLISENLQKIHSQAEEIISSHIQRLDRISNDIRALEEILLKAAVPFKFSYHLKTEILYVDGKKTDLKNYFLFWDKKRIIYKITNGGLFGKEIESTPLIETKSQIRLFVENEISIFYEEIIKSLKEDPMQEIVFIISPNHKKVEIELPF